MQITPAIRVFVATAVIAVLSSCSVTDNDTADATGCCTVGKTSTAIASTKTKTYAFATPKPVKILRSESAAKTASATTVNPSRTAFLGNAPYICSPSGFGRKSACFLR